MERRERREQDVQLAPPLQLRLGAGHVLVAEGHVRRVDEEVRQRSAPRVHRPGDRPLPVGGERLPVQRAQQVEVHWIGAQLHVVDGEHGAADLERHVPEQP
jgi:hypothetical protein